MKINVVVTAYNHEQYITQCLESILNQKGDFQLEIIVGEDSSTDQTRTILESFQDRYPEIIFVFPEGQNLGIQKNLKRCLEACSGEYIAICEGDDYWTDEYKLQKQKDFLESRRDCSMCFSALLLYYQEKNLMIPHHTQSMLQKDTITIEDLIIEGNCIGNFSCCMYRTNVVKRLPQKIYEVPTDDWLFNMACSQLGNIGFLQDQMSVYRIHSQGAWSGKDRFEQLDYVRNYIDMANQFFDYQYDALFRQRKKFVEDRIIYLRSLVDEQKKEDRSFKSFLLELILRWKALVKKILQIQ